MLHRVSLIRKKEPYLFKDFLLKHHFWYLDIIQYCFVLFQIKEI